MSTAVSLLISPITISFCRRKSTRLTAVMGGLVTALGCLFTSFATQFHQLFFSYGTVIGECLILFLSHLGNATKKMNSQFTLPSRYRWACLGSYMWRHPQGEYASYNARAEALPAPVIATLSSWTVGKWLKRRCTMFKWWVTIAKR